MYFVLFLLGKRGVKGKKKGNDNMRKRLVTKNIFLLHALTKYLFTFQLLCICLVVQASWPDLNINW